VHELELAGRVTSPRHLAHARAATSEVGLHLGPGNAVLAYRAAAEAECLIRRIRLSAKYTPAATGSTALRSRRAVSLKSVVITSVLPLRVGGIVAGYGRVHEPDTGAVGSGPGAGSVVKGPATSAA
jgi:hypothetical protein